MAERSSGGGEGTAPRTWTLWLCDNCREWAEDAPGEPCEYSCGGTIQRYEVVELSRCRELEEAAAFALACIPPEHPGPCGTDACWLCSAETSLRAALSSAGPGGEQHEG